MKLILGFSVPLLFGYLFQQLYNLVDTMIVGQFLGVDALAAVGATGSINFLIIGFCNGVCSGFALPVAHRFGAKDYKTLRKLYANSIWLSVIFAVVMTALTVIFCRPILTLMRTPENIFEYSYQYILIIFIGIPATYLFNLTSGMIRALGNSRAPLIILVISSFLNVILDLVFILNFNMGVAGAAAATVLSQVVSGIICVIYIRKKVEMLQLSKDEWRMEKREMAELFNAGVPMGLQYSITAIGTMMVQTSQNLLGSNIVAAFTAASKIEQVVTQAYVALGTTMATYCAQNIGAGKIKRIREGFKSSTIMASIYAVVTAALIMTVGKYMTYLFVSDNVIEIMSNVDIYLKCIGVFFIPLAIVNLYRNGIQGMGYGLLPMMAGVAELIGRGVVAVIAANKRSYFGVCMASPAAWVLAGGLLLVMYYYIMLKDMKRKFPNRIE